MGHILAIDPGDARSAYVVLNDSTYYPIKFEKILNEELRDSTQTLLHDNQINHVAIEAVASYGMPVGKEIFDTCIWIGRYAERCEMFGATVHLIYRKEIKMNLCGQTKAKDTNIRIALIDRFAQHDTKNGKGTKGNPDIFYGFASDIWSAMACGTTFLDKGGDNK